jgi:hypothetical protein
VAILTRPSSATKPAALALKGKGVQIRIADAGSDDLETLMKVLDGVDVLVSTVAAFALETQFRVFDAAKAAGVKR